MSLKTILVPLEESDVLPSVLECALLVSQRFGSYIEGLHIRPLPAEVLTAAGEGLYAGTTDLLENLEQRDNERAQRTREYFDQFMADHGVERGDAGQSPRKPVAAWLEEAMPGDEVVGNRGRLFDLVVVGRPVGGTATPSRSRLESAIFESGRLTLIAPPTTPTALGDTIVIAWNSSTETARTVALAMPFLEQAKQVIVLSVEDYGVPGPNGSELRQSLVRNGVAAQASVIPRGKRSIARAVLEETASIGGDLLIKGAYTQSRLRQMIFGGVTNEILATAELPVLMSH
jgi:nucleotide-binding universal stress UspA family protein